MVLLAIMILVHGDIGNSQMNYEWQHGGRFSHLMGEILWDMSLELYKYINMIPSVCYGKLPFIGDLPIKKC